MKKGDAVAAKVSMFKKMALATVLVALAACYAQADDTMKMKVPPLKTPGDAKVDTSRPVPAWLQEKIDTHTRVNGVIVQQVYVATDVEGREVYHIPGACCDIMGSWHDAEGKVLCSYGGITGKINGECPRVTTPSVLIYDAAQSKSR